VRKTLSILTMKINEVVSRNLRRLRRKEGLSQEALGHAAGIERSYVGKIEQKGVNLTIDLIAKLSFALRCEPAEFFQITERERKLVRRGLLD
jgi:transcriptional regulator with XRE-family HTH domain